MWMLRYDEGKGRETTLSVGVALNTLDIMLRTLGKTLYYSQHIMNFVNIPILCVINTKLTAPKLSAWSKFPHTKPTR